MADKLFSRKLKLIETTATARREIPLDSLQRLVPVPNANYTLIEEATRKPPQGLVLRRVKGNLLVEVEGEQAAEIQNFYSDGSGSTFTTDGSTSAAAAAPDSVISAVAQAGAQQEAVVVWPAGQAGALGVAAAGSGLGVAAAVAAVAVAAAAGGGSGSPSAGGGGGGGGADTTPPNAPTSVQRDPTDNGLPGDGVVVRVTFGPDAVAGDRLITVVYRDGVATGTTLTTTLTAADITRGYAQQTVPAGDVAVDGTFRVDAHLVDAAGNVGATLSVARAFLVFTSVVQDDFIANSRVFIDLNFNNRYDAGEPVTTTDARGKFRFAVDPGNAPILAVGGVDTASGAPLNNLVLKSSLAAVTNPGGSGTDLVLSPISTVITEVAQQRAGQSVDAAALNQAATSVNAVLGLSVNQPASLLTTDVVERAISTTSAPSAQDLSLLAANRQLAVVMSSASALVAGGVVSEGDSTGGAAASVRLPRGGSGGISPHRPANLEAGAEIPLGPAAIVQLHLHHADRTQAARIAAPGGVLLRRGLRGLRRQLGLDVARPGIPAASRR